MAFAMIGYFAWMITEMVRGPVAQRHAEWLFGGLAMRLRTRRE